MHVAEGVDVHHERHRGDDDEHHHRDGVEQDAHVEMQGAQRQPREVIGHNGLVDALGCASVGDEILERRQVADERHHTERAGADEACRLVRHLHSRKSEQDEREQGKKKYQK